MTLNIKDKKLILPILYFGHYYITRKISFQVSVCGLRIRIRVIQKDRIRVCNTSLNSLVKFKSFYLHGCCRFPNDVDWPPLLHKNKSVLQVMIYKHRNSLTVLCYTAPNTSGQHSFLRRTIDGLRYLNSFYILTLQARIVSLHSVKYVFRKLFQMYI